MTITICIGSSCHIKGSKEVVEKIEKLVEKHDVEGKIELKAAFCMGECLKGVCVKLDEELYSLLPSNVEKFFYDEVLRRL